MVQSKTFLGCVGFGHIEGSWIWHMFIVRGKHCHSIPLIYPLYYIMNVLYERSVKRNLENLETYGTSKNIRN